MGRLVLHLVRHSVSDGGSWGAVGRRSKLEALGPASLNTLVAATVLNVHRVPSLTIFSRWSANRVSTRSRHPSARMATAR
jgi:hypothetical protein